MGKKNYTTASCKFNKLSTIAIDTMYCVLILLNSTVVA